MGATAGARGGAEEFGPRAPRKRGLRQSGPAAREKTERQGLPRAATAGIARYGRCGGPKLGAP